MADAALLEPDERDLRQIVAADPGNVDALNRLGELALKRGAVQDAVPLFETALALAPDRPELHDRLGLCHYQLRNFALAIRSFEAALEIVPNHVDVTVNLGKALIRRQRFAAAAECFRRAAERQPERADIQFHLGDVLRCLGRTSEAVIALREALRHRPDYPATLLQLGLAYGARLETDIALKFVRRALALTPRNVYAMATEASLLAQADAEQRLAGKAGAKRVAIHINRSFHYAFLKPVFDAMLARHHGLITGDTAALMAFDPAVIVVADAQTARLRPLLPRARFVFTHHGLISKNQNFAVARLNDYVCVTGEAMRDMMVERADFAPDRVWVTGYPQMDALFATGPSPLAALLPGDRKTVLYGPAYNSRLSSAPMLGERIVEYIRGARDDLTILIKPHPLSAEPSNPWMGWWKKAAARNRNVHLIADPAADVMPYLKAADLLISDATSLTFEFLPMNRPIVLLTNPERHNDPRYDPDGIEWRWRDMGEEIFRPEDLAGAVGRALDQPARFEGRRLRYRDLVFGGLAGGSAAERIAARITELDLGAKR